MKTKKAKQLLTIVLSLLMLASVVPTVSFTAFAIAAGPVSDWAALQEALYDGGDVTLGGDITAPAGASALSVPKNKTVRLYLDGHTIDRALSAETENGSVFIVSGDLDVYGPGTVTGGNTTGSDGGFRVKKDGFLALCDDAVVTGNHARYSGGGVYISGSNAEFSLYGAVITENSAKNGGGLA